MYFLLAVLYLTDFVICYVCPHQDHLLLNNGSGMLLSSVMLVNTVLAAALRICILKIERV